MLNTGICVSDEKHYLVVTKSPLIRYYYTGRYRLYHFFLLENHFFLGLLNHLGPSSNERLP